MIAPAPRWPEVGTWASDDFLASADASTRPDGRHVRLSTYGGWDLEIHPDRGLDIGTARLRGIPISWVSPVRDARPLDDPRGDAWLRRFTGGLVTTCGFRGFGPATAERGLHGDADHLPAIQVSLDREVTPDLARARVTAILEDARMFGASLRVRREIAITSTRAGAAELTLTDDLVNLGPGTLDIGVLYHVNIGAPLLAPGSTLRVPAAQHRVRGGASEASDGVLVPTPVRQFAEYVVESSGLASRDGEARAEVTGVDGTLEIAWSADSLPIAVRWVFPTVNRFGAAIEPATSSLLDPEAGTVPLREGELRRHRLTIRPQGAS